MGFSREPPLLELAIDKVQTRLGERLRSDERHFSCFIAWQMSGHGGEDHVR